MIGYKYGVEPSYRISDLQGMAWTRGVSHFYMSVHATEYITSGSANDVSYHRARFVLRSIVSTDKSGDSINDVEASKVIWG